MAGVIHHGIDASHFPVGDGTGDGDGPYCLFLGRMAPDKGAHRAIAVARKAGDADTDGGQDARGHGRSATSPRWSSRCSAPTPSTSGEVPHEQKLELLGGATALLFPIRWNEPFGLVMLEAMACGTPVLAFPEGAAPEVVVHGMTGFLCDDEEDMTEALGRIARDPAGRLPGGGGGLLLHQADGGRPPRPLRLAGPRPMRRRGRLHPVPFLTAALVLMACLATAGTVVTSGAVEAAGKTVPTEPSPPAVPRPFGKFACTPEYGIRFCPGGIQGSRDLRVPSFDGVPLDADVALPATGKGPFPLIVLLHGLGESKTEFGGDLRRRRHRRRDPGRPRLRRPHVHRPGLR